MNAKTITLRIEPDPTGEDSIRGRAIDERGEREFTGWLGLIGVLDSLLATGGSGNGATTSNHHEE